MTLDLTATGTNASGCGKWRGRPPRHRRTDGSEVADLVGTVLKVEPPRTLVITFASPGEDTADEPSQVTLDIEAHGDIVRLTVTHEN
jgi:uncharacterized protein YndB with AHSA1/START domain